MRQIRHQVFVIEQAVDPTDEWDEHDQTAWHVLAVTPEGIPMGTGRIHEYEPGIGKLCRIAVLAEYRRRGVGTAITRALVERARELEFQEVKLHAQTHAVSVYESVGFRVYGDEFLECGIPHLAMRLVIE